MAGKIQNMTPKEIVAELDKYIIGQERQRNLWPSPSETDIGEVCFLTR